MTWRTNRLMNRLAWLPLLALLSAAAFAAPPEATEREFNRDEYARHNAALARLAEDQGFERSPELVRGYVPAYPHDGPAQGRSGRCALAFTIAASGAIEDVQHSRQDHAGMCEQAERALGHWQFRPGVRDGQPVAMRMRIPFDFDPEGVPEGPQLYRADARQRGADFDMRVEEVSRDEQASRLRVPGVHARSAAQSRWLMCMYTELAALRGFEYWQARYPSENEDTVVLDLARSRPDGADAGSGDDMVAVEEMAAACRPASPRPPHGRRHWRCRHSRPLVGTVPRR